MSETIEKPVSEMTSAELEAFLEQKKKAEKAEQKRLEREYEAEKNEFVEAAAKRFQQFHNALTAFKLEVLGEGNALHSKMYQVYQKPEKDIKSFSLVNEAGTMKITLERNEKQGFGEQAEVAINEIKDILREKFEGRNKGMYKIIDDLLSTNKAGDYDPRLVSKLRKHEEHVDDKRFSEALDLLAKSYTTEGTALYARAYVRENSSKPWEDVSLQFSALA